MSSRDTTTDTTTLEAVTETGAVAELALQAAGHESVPAMPLADDVQGRTEVRGTVLHASQRLELTVLERYDPAPARVRGTAELNDPAAFMDYVKRLGSESTTVWVSCASKNLQPYVTAVFNDHTAHGAPGWRDHRAALLLEPTPDWLHWTRADGQLMDQLAFAELIEDGITAVVAPDGATMLEIAQTFHAARKVEFSSVRRVTNGDVQLRWHNDTQASAGRGGNEIEIPEEFTLLLAPWLGAPSYEVIARLRWRLHDGQLSLGYRLHRLHDVLRVAVNDLIAGLDVELEFPVLQGQPPAPIVSL